MYIHFFFQPIAKWVCQWAGRSSKDWEVLFWALGLYREMGTKHYDDCGNTSRYCLENTIYIQIQICFLFGFLFFVVFWFFFPPEPSEKKIQEQNWQFWLSVSHEQPNDTVCCIFSWRELMAEHFLILLGYGCLQKLNKYCRQSITHYLKI